MSWIVASFTEGRIVVVDYTAGRVHCDLHLSIPGAHPFALSPCGQYIAVACNAELGTSLEIWRIPEGRIQAELTSRAEIISLAVAPGGRHVVYGTAHATYACEVANRRGGQQLKSCVPSYASAMAQRAGLLLPGTAASTLCAVWWAPCRIEYLSVPVAGRISQVCCAPDTSESVLRAGRSKLYVYDYGSHDILVERTCPVRGVMCYANAGQLVTISEGRRLIVFDRRCKEVLCEWEIPACVAGALDERRLLCADGSIVDVFDGRVDPAASKASWWRALGL